MFYYYYYYYTMSTLMSLSARADDVAHGGALRDTMGAVYGWQEARVGRCHLRQQSACGALVQADSLAVRRWVERGWMRLGWL